MEKLAAPGFMVDRRKSEERTFAGVLKVTPITREMDSPYVKKSKQMNELKANGVDFDQEQ